MDESRSSGKRNIIISLAVAGVLAIAVLGVLSMTKKDTAADAMGTATPATSSSVNTSTPTPSTDQQATDSSASSAATTKYKDGTYTASASYSFPNGSEILTLKTTLKSDIITDASVSVAINDEESREYVNSFLGGYKALVIGKDASSLKLSRVAGSSLTSSGFNDALDKIRNQAS